MPALRHALSQIEGMITLDDPFVQPALREGDVAIMEIVLSGNFTDVQVDWINAV